MIFLLLTCKRAIDSPPVLILRIVSDRKVNVWLCATEICVVFSHVPVVWRELDRFGTDKVEDDTLLVLSIIEEEEMPNF